MLLALCTLASTNARHKSRASDGMRSKGAYQGSSSEGAHLPAAEASGNSGSLDERAAGGHPPPAPARYKPCRHGCGIGRRSTRPVRLQRRKTPFRLSARSAGPEARRAGYRRESRRGKAAGLRPQKPYRRLAPWTRHPARWQSHGPSEHREYFQRGGEKRPSGRSKGRGWMEADRRPACVVCQCSFHDIIQLRL